MIRLAVFPITVALAVLILFFLATGDAGASPRTVRAVICEVFGQRCGPALRVAACESGLNPWARGRAGELSIFQVHPIWFWRTVRSTAGRIYVNPRRLHDPLYASRVAFVMSKGGTDWTPWAAVCRP